VFVGLRGQGHEAAEHRRAFLHRDRRRQERLAFG
jgi:hypothetical protein